MSGKRKKKRRAKRLLVLSIATFMLASLSLGFVYQHHALYEKEGSKLQGGGVLF